jgi:hypothetical protein
MLAAESIVAERLRDGSMSRPDVLQNATRLHVESGASRRRDDEGADLACIDAAC